MEELIYASKEESGLKSCGCTAKIVSRTTHAIAFAEATAHCRGIYLRQAHSLKGCSNQMLPVPSAGSSSIKLRALSCTIGD